MATGFDFDWRTGHFVIGAESADFWRPLGVAIIFGLSVSTFLTLVIVPTFYSLLDDWIAAVKKFALRFANRKELAATTQN
ncbi:efflux RND transporter permease subunit [Sphingobacteriales bacterium CHB3]|nr:efflux RND transporter permease subunit [Sphingobacteriales bacterium CHB3]